VLGKQAVAHKGKLKGVTLAMDLGALPMNSRFFLLALVITAVVWQSIRAAAPEAATTQNSAPVDPPTGAPAEALEVRYAKAQLRLAEANLARVERINQRLAKVVSPDVVAEYRQELDVAKSLVKSAEGAAGAKFDVWLQRAAAGARSTQSAWRSVAAAERRVPGTFDPLDIERLRLRAEVARLELARGKSMAASPRLVQVEWQMDLVGGELQRLKEDLRSPPTSRTYFVWPY